MIGRSYPQERGLTTAEAGRLVGYSTQQVRDLERIGVLPAAERRPNGYRRYTARHVTALQAYRALAAAIGPVPARRLAPVLRTESLDAAAARIDELHADLAAERARVQGARAGLAAVLRDPDAVFEERDAMSIGEMAQALAVRPSALRHWEGEGLVVPGRVGGIRRYGTAAIAEARIVAALRSGGYGIPAIARVLEQVRLHGVTGEAQRLLDERLTALTRRSVALLAAAGQLHALLTGER